MGFGRAGNGLVWSEVWVAMLNRAWILRHSSECDIGCVALTHSAHDAQPTMRVLTDEKRKRRVFLVQPKAHPICARPRKTVLIGEYTPP